MSRLVALLVMLVARAAAAAPAAAPGPFERELEERRAQLERDDRRPQAIVPLLGLLELWDLVEEPAAIAALLDRVADDARARADVRARADYLRAIVLDRLGKRAAAQRVRARLGLITRWWVAGPFDNEGRTGHATVFGPEAELARPLALTAAWPGKERRVGWRLAPDVATGGLVPLDAFLRPDAHATAYLTVAVRVARATHASLRVGSSGAVKAWLNGAPVLDRDVYRPLRFDQDAAAVQLQAGWNRLTVKVSVDEGTWRLFARLAAPDGGPLDGVELSTESTHLVEAAATRPARATFRLVDLGAELEAATRAHDPDALAALGAYLHYVAPDDAERHRAAEVLTEALRRRGTAERWLLLAHAQTDPNDQRQALESGLHVAAGAARAPLATEVGELDERAHRERRAELQWREAQAADPGWFPAALHLADLAADRGLPARAAEILAAVAGRHRAPPIRLLRAEAQLAARRGRRAQAESIWRRLADANAEDEEALGELFSLERARGDVAAALATAARLQAARPDLLTPRLDRADVLEGAGRLAEAHDALAETLAIAPDDARLNERDGRLLHRLGREPEALARLRHALELKPQNPELRAYLAELVPKDAEGRSDLARSFAADVAQLIARARKQAPPPGAPARVLLDSEATRVHPNGLSETFQQRVVEILDERGAREHGDYDIRFTPDTQSIELRAAKVYKKNGEVLEAAATDEQDLSEPWYGLYYDVKAQVVRFAALEPGDVVDVEYVVSDIAHRNIFADYFGDLHFLQEELPRLESRYVLIAPRARTLYFNQPRLPGLEHGLEHKEETRGDDTIYTFRAVDTPKIDSEPGMPGYSELAAYVHVSTYKTWEGVAAWYQGLLKGQLEANPAIRRAVAQATLGITDEKAKIRAIYDLVVTRTRYVGLEFGIHGYQPYRVPTVFARKFGDCKDKAALLVVMLREAGIKATMTLARTRHGGDLDPEPASLAPFDHAIAYVPKYDWYLDGTAEFSGADELPAQDQDIPVLQVEPGKLVRTPVLPAARNQVSAELRVALDAAGAARVDEKMVIRGEAAHDWRNAYQSPGERQEKYAKAWNERLPGAKLTRLDMAVEDRQQPVAVNATVEAPHWARQSGQPGAAQLVMPALGRDADMLRSYARLSSRQHDLILGYPWRQEDRVTVTLPAGWAVARLPEARTLSAAMGRFTLTVETRGREVTVRGILEIDRHRIARADYAAFRKFCGDVDDAVAQELIVAPAATVP